MQLLKLDLNDGIKGCFESSVQNKVLYLNETFMIDEILIDGISSNCKISKHHKTQVITIPQAAKTIKLKYHGALDGKSGLYPYVIENTNDDFYLLRHESLYYPSFYAIDSEEFLDHYLYPQKDDEFIVSVKMSSLRSIISNLNKADDKLYHGFAPVFAIGYFQVEEAFFGNIHYLKGTLDIASKIEFIMLINKILLKYKQVYLNDLQMIIIPPKYGSFVMPDHHTMFITEDSFDDPQFLIHELIHLHWNPKCMPKVQNARFFDEAITQYLTLRVLTELNIKNKQQIKESFLTEFKDVINEAGLQIKPLCQYAEHNYGVLSYSYGPLALLRIEEHIGAKAMDEAIRFMLNDEMMYDFARFKSIFTEIENVWHDCFETCNYQYELLNKC